MNGDEIRPLLDEINAGLVGLADLGGIPPPLNDTRSSRLAASSQIRDCDIPIDYRIIVRSEQQGMTSEPKRTIGGGPVNRAE